MRSLELLVILDLLAVLKISRQKPPDVPTDLQILIATLSKRTASTLRLGCLLVVKYSKASKQHPLGLGEEHVV